MVEYKWTKKAETRARELGLDDRKAGMSAHYAGKDGVGGMIAAAWIEAGLIEEVSDAD